MRVAGSLLFLVLACSVLDATIGNVVRHLTVTVMDTRGEPVQGARVSLCNLDTEQGADACVRHVSTEQGSVELSIAPTARYEIRVELEGFLPTTLGPLRLRESERDWVAYPNLVALLNAEVVY
jgi:hypothetical protein